MEDDEMFDLNTINLDEYELVTSDDGSIMIQDNCVFVTHTETKAVKVLPLTEEVLQALGLALVLDEDEVKNSELKSDTEIVSGEQENGETVNSEVFADDEDAAQLNESNVSANKSTNSDKDALLWSDDLVYSLLDLYERNQVRFFTNPNRHRQIWKDIHKEMCVQHPEMKSWNETHVQSKFGGLKRTFRGAIEYFKDNLHTTKWPFFDRMEHLMNRNLELHKQHTSEVKPNTWQAKWTLLLLEIVEESITDDEASVYWHDIREKIVRAEPEFEWVTVEQVQEKFSQLTDAYRQCQVSGVKPKGDLKDKAVYEKLSRILTEEDETVNSDIPRRSVTCMEVDQESIVKDQESVQSAELNVSCKTPRSPGLGRKALSGPIKITSGPKSSPSRTKPGPIRAKGGATIKASPKIARHENKSSPMSRVESRNSRFGGESWSPTATGCLLDTYRETRLVLDETGPKFWTQLADTLNKKQPSLMVDAGRCETKVQCLYVKYKALERAAAADTSWPYYNKMHQIFGTESVQWPNKVTELLIDAYHAHVPRLEAAVEGEREREREGEVVEEEEVEEVWRSVAARVSAAGGGRDVTSEECRAQVDGLRRKYCRLLNDHEAAGAWPFFTRMSELFPTDTWPAVSIRLLVRLCRDRAGLRAGHRTGHRAGQGPWWRALAARYSAESARAPATPRQCRDRVRDHAQELYEVFGEDDTMTGSGGDESDQDEVGKDLDMDLYIMASADTEQENTTEDSNDVVKDEFVWTHEAISRMLELYRGVGTRRGGALWRRIDRRLADLYPNYRPGKEGYGGWLKYLELMTKYMDIKERRCTEKDWPYYKLMEDIVSARGRGSMSEASSDTQLDRLRGHLNVAAAVGQKTERAPSYDQSLLQSILEEIKRKNAIDEKRCQLMKMHLQAKKAHHRESIVLLKKIHATLKDLAVDEKNEMLRVMERTLEEIHK